MAGTTRATAPAPEDVAIPEPAAIPDVPQEPPENLGTADLLTGQGDNAPPEQERIPVEDLGLDALLGVDGQ